MFGLRPPPPTLEDTSLRMMKQGTGSQPGTKAPRGVSQQFEFINLLNSPELTDVGTKRAVRAHAMRDFRRRRGESYHNGRCRESSSIKATDSSKLSPKVQSGRNGIALEPPEWTSSPDPAEDSSSLIDTSCDVEDFPILMPRERDSDLFQLEPGFFPEITCDGSDSANGRDQLGVVKSPASPRNRKKAQKHVASPVTPSEDGDCPSTPSGRSVRSSTLVASPRLAITPGAGSPDPFNALPIESTTRVHILMHHYMSVFVRPGSQMIPRETWISEALNDSALFQATLLPSAAHYALLYNLDLAESFHLFDQTTQTVYKRLNDPEQGTSDATLAAVICLSFVENVLGNSSASTVHVEGLKRMVDLRGGLQALGFKGVLQRMVLWADNWTGILALSPPRFPFMKQIQGTSYYSATDPNITKLKSVLQDDHPGTSLIPVDSDEYQDNVFGIILGLQQLSRTLAAIHANETTVKEAMQFNERVFFLERQLLLSLVTDEQPHGYPFEFFLMRSFSHAAYIYIYSTLHSTLRDLPLQMPFFGIFVERLQAALHDGEFLLAWCSTSPVMLLWVLVVGTIAADRRPQRDWFMNQLTSVCLSLKISDFNKLRDLLREMMWVDGALDSSLKALWSELQRWTAYSLDDLLLTT